MCTAFHVAAHLILKLEAEEHRSTFRATSAGRGAAWPDGTESLDASPADRGAGVGFKGSSLEASKTYCWHATAALSGLHFVNMIMVCPLSSGLRQGVFMHFLPVTTTKLAAPTARDYNGQEKGCTSKSKQHGWALDSSWKACKAGIRCCSDRTTPSRVTSPLTWLASIVAQLRNKQKPQSLCSLQLRRYPRQCFQHLR